MWNWFNASRPLVGALVLGGLASMGCVDNTVSLFIRQVQAPQLAGAACTFTNDPSSASIPEGTLDVAIAESYKMAPLLANQQVSQANMDQRRAETSFVNVQGFVVELHEGSPEGVLIGSPFSVYQNVVVPPSLAAGTPGYAFASLEVIPPQITAALRDAVCRISPAPTPTAECPVPRYQSADRRVIVKLTAFGDSLGQHGVESVPFIYPVRVCCGCLVAFPTDSDAAETLYPGPDCRGGNAVQSLATCRPGQDFALDCRFCSTDRRYVGFCNPPGFNAFTPASRTPGLTCPTF